MIFKSALTKFEKIFHEEYELSSTIRHRGEKGRQRENGLITFLKDHLPSAYGMATGEIIPFKGGDTSPQCDIIIYDHLHMPILYRSKAVQQVPLEAVYCVIECKSVIDKAALKDAGNKFECIRALPRCKYNNKLKRGMTRGPAYFLFGYKRKASYDACLEFVQDSGKDTAIVCLDSGLSLWVGDRSKPVWLDGTEPENNVYETLALFYLALIMSLRDIDLGNPNLMDLVFSWE